MLLERGESEITPELRDGHPAAAGQPVLAASGFPSLWALDARFAEHPEEVVERLPLRDVWTRTRERPDRLRGRDESLRLHSPAAGAETLTTTHEHPSPVCDEWLQADELEPGTVVQTRFGTASVSSLRYSVDRQTVYNPTVAETRTYLVSDDKVWVHDCELVSNLQKSHALKADHKWDKLFSNPDAKWREIEDLLMLTAREGTPGPLVEHANGFGQTYTMTHRGETAWATISTSRNSKNIYISNGGIN